MQLVETPTVTAEWRAMGSAVEVRVIAPVKGDRLIDVDQLINIARSRIAELESKWSRFRDDSDISRLNRFSGQPVDCDPTTVTLVTRMVEGWFWTKGTFDPTLLIPLVSLGYQESWDQPGRTDPNPTALWRGRPDEILIDQANSAVTLPFGTTIDPGGIGKGLAADLVAAELLQLGATGVLISVGGDISVGGTPPDGDGWIIEVEPYPGADAVDVAIAAGGIATSTNRLRRWSRSEHEYHHLLDPSSGQPTRSTVTGCAVIAGSAATAEVFTKAAFVLGPDEALRLYRSHGVAARIWSGNQTVTTGWEPFATKGTP